MIQKLLFFTALISSIAYAHFNAAEPTTAKNAPPVATEATNTLITNSRQLTFVGPRSGEGYFSADGSKMIFQSEREPGNPFYQMFVLDLKSGETERVSPGQGKTTCGWIHPNGKKVMWSSTHLDKGIAAKVKEEYETRKKPVKGRYSWSYDDNFDIFESDLKGKNVKRLTREKGYDAEGSYSPDGQWIAFASNRAAYTEKLSPEDQKRFDQDASYMMDIYIMKADGTQVKRLTTEKGYDGGPFFSPDGKKITWRRFNADGSKAEVYVMNVDGTDQKALTHLGSMSWAPYFHPSGDYIIFTTSVNGFANFELYIVDAEGKHEPVRATFLPDFDGLPVFAPANSPLEGKISWSHRNEKGESQIYIADWDDTQARKLLGLAPEAPKLQNLSKDISVPDLKSWVYWLADESKQGRPAGGPGEKAMVEHYAAYFKSLGLVGGAPNGEFIQPFTFTSNVSLGAHNALEWKGAYAKALKIGPEAEPYSLSANGDLSGLKAVFAGYGIKAPAVEGHKAYNSYEGVDVNGKWAVVIADVPEGLPREETQHLTLYGRLQHKVTVAREAGAKGLIVIEGLQALKAPRQKSLRFEGAMSTTTLAVWRAGGEWVKDLFKSSGQDFAAVKKDLDKGTMVSFDFKGDLSANTELVAEKSTAYNVIAKLPAKSKAAGKSSGGALLLGAHGDHLGFGGAGTSLARGEEIGKAHLGADDNASGVAGVMELAQHFTQGRGVRKPVKDIYFAIWSAEEIGILGSKAFVDDWTKAKGPMKNTFWYSINLDMIGRLRNQLQIQGTGSGDHWSRLAEEVAVRNGLATTQTEDPYLPSDAMTFYMAGLPSIMFFTGSHAEYHSPRDRAETLNYEGEKRVVDFVAELSTLLTDSSARLVSYKEVKGNPAKNLEGRTFRIYLGTIPDYSQEGVKGVRLSGVSADSPALKAGLKEKDVIVRFAGMKIENIYDYVYTLQSAKPNIETEIVVRRGDKDIELKIVPGLKE